MEIGTILTIKTRSEWRAWLSKNHTTAKDVWLVNYKKHTGQTNVGYAEAVEEALCFGWIDSIVKRLDDDRTVQRYSPRKPNSVLSELNKVRIRKLIKAGKMTEAGMRLVEEKLQEPFVIADDILEQLQADKKVWQYFEAFEEDYKRIRIGWIEGARKRPEEFAKRLKHFLDKTRKNEQFGMVE